MAATKKSIYISNTVTNQLVLEQKNATNINSIPAKFDSAIASINKLVAVISKVTLKAPKVLGGFTAFKANIPDQELRTMAADIWPFVNDVFKNNFSIDATLGGTAETSINISSTSLASSGTKIAAMYIAYHIANAHQTWLEYNGIGSVSTLNNLNITKYLDGPGGTTYKAQDELQKQVWGWESNALLGIGDVTGLSISALSNASGQYTRVNTQTKLYQELINTSGTFVTAFGDPRIGNFTTTKIANTLNIATGAFTIQKGLIVDPKFGVTRIFPAGGAPPVTELIGVYLDTEDDIKEYLGQAPLASPNTTQLNSMKTVINGKGVPLTKKGVKDVSILGKNKGAPLGFICVSTTSTNANNIVPWSNDSATIADTSKTPDQKIDWMAGKIISNSLGATFVARMEAIPPGDPAILQATPPPAVAPPPPPPPGFTGTLTPLEEVDEEAILKEVEESLAAQERGLTRTEIVGTVVDGRTVEDGDPIPVPNCLLKEVVDGVVKPKTYESDKDGKINIPDFGATSVLRIIPPSDSGFGVKDFGPPNSGLPEIDFIYELDGEPLIPVADEIILEDDTLETDPEVIEEPVDPRLVGGTVVNSLTSEPIENLKVTYGIGRNKIETVTNSSGEFTLSIPVPFGDKLGDRLDKITAQIEQSQKSALNPQNAFYKGQEIVNSGLQQITGGGRELLEGYLDSNLSGVQQQSQYGNNILTTNADQITNLDNPGILTSIPGLDSLNLQNINVSTGNAFLDQQISTFNQGVNLLSEAGGPVGLYGQGVNQLNALSNKGSNFLQSQLNYLQDPLGTQTFQDIKRTKDRLNELIGKLPGRKIVIKGEGLTAGELIKYRTLRISPFTADNELIEGGDLDIIKVVPRTIGIRKSLRKIQYKDQFDVNPSLSLVKFKEKLRDFNLISAIKRAKLKRELTNSIMKNLFVQVLVPLGCYYLDPILQNVKTDINELIRENDILCPSGKQLKNLIKTVNLLNNALSRTYSAINSATVAVKAGNSFLNAIQISIEVYQFTPFFFGVFTLPDTITKLNSDKIQKTKNDLQKGKVINENILLWLTDISSDLSKAVDIVKVCQGLLEKCLQESQPNRSSSDPDLSIDPIIADLEEINEFVNSQITTPDTGIIEINGFKLQIESEVNNASSLNIPRKRAIAKDINNVTVLKGEYSYTADPQILIEELRFYIKINDLKAE